MLEYWAAFSEPLGTFIIVIHNLIGGVTKLVTRFVKPYLRSVVPGTVISVASQSSGY
ncbi:hypothetical protein M378DRAFT_19098 [Amanita muscaria Koide BX008]|uniref:Uncharacterized protein n=1 Tax=Amanita muscaria (strain Koide BX008) TaxID=946122 RepID=A0A0C2VZG0_AMAMK|nr:hypothetical protein M378DRAFT_19098 [Amanita muscaria Koide BX008]